MAARVSIRSLQSPEFCYTIFQYFSTSQARRSGPLFGARGSRVIHPVEE